MTDKMTSSSLQSIKSKLQQRLQVLLEVETVGQASAAAVQLDQSRVGRLSRMDALQSQAMSLESNRRRQIEIQKIKSALQRLESNEYGDCVICGERINAKRLEIDMAATHCIECASRAEQDDGR